jgi:2'-5' RNA ligase
MAKAKGGTLRAFVALDLDPTGLRRVVRLSDRLRMSSGAPSAAWVPGNKMHVTLKFVAALPVEAVEPLGKALAALAEGKAAPPPCGLRLDAFPSAARASVVVAELVDDKKALAKLAAKVDKLVAKYGVAAETRDFRPHVTLARVKLEYDARRWMRPELTEVAGECRMAALTLYKSILKEEGASYEVLGRWAFDAPALT